MKDIVYLRLCDLRDNRTLEFETDSVRLGRDPEFELVVEGPGSEVVSVAHVQFVHRDGAWWLEDIGGRNGTFLDGKRIVPDRPEQVRKGQVVALGSKGLRFEIEAIEQRRVAETLIEQPQASPLDATVPMNSVPHPLGGAARAAPPPPPTLTVSVRDVRSGKQLDARGGRIRIGRGKECELRPVEAGDTSVSRVHCEIVLKPDGGVVLRDARSRNGTILNGEVVRAERSIGQGDRIKLGDAGPELLVEKLILPTAAADLTEETPAVPPPSPALMPAAEPVAPPPARARRSFAGKGRTVFFKELIHETEQRSATRVRWLVWIFVGLLVIGVGGVYWWSERRVRQTEAELAAQREVLTQQRVLADSVRAAAAAEYRRLGVELERASASAAPAAVVDSLRTALAEAEQRTTALEDALRRAQESVNQQLAVGDSLRREAQVEIERLRDQLASSSGGNVPRGALDSLRQAVAAAEQRAVELAAGLRAVRGVDLAHIAQANQGAVGLVSAFAGKDIYDGSGFAITASGYFITNRHVVAPDGKVADSVFVAMADQRTSALADVIAVEPEPGPDLAVIKIRNYTGPYVPRVDWSGTRARQGEPAALIGFPAGVAAALDRSHTVRTSMSAGIFSKVTPEMIQFDGFTVGGSSGSPIFNAQGEVVAVHAQGLREAAGLAFTVPIKLVIPLLPAEVRARLTGR